MVLLGLTPLYPIVLIWTIIDIILLKKKGAAPAYKLKDAIWAIVLLVIIIPVFIVVAVTGLYAVGNWYSEKYVLVEQTINEGNHIATAIREFKSSNGYLPEQIADLTNNFPLRAGWLKDSWGEPYHYQKLNSGTDFRIVSKGPDRALNTEDDICFK